MRGSAPPPPRRPDPARPGASGSPRHAQLTESWIQGQKAGAPPASQQRPQATTAPRCRRLAPRSARPAATCRCPARRSATAAPPPTRRPRDQGARALDGFGATVEGLHRPRLRRAGGGSKAPLPTTVGQSGKTREGAAKSGNPPVGVLLVNLGTPDSPAHRRRAALPARVPRAIRACSTSTRSRRCAAAQPGHPALPAGAVRRGLPIDLDRASGSPLLVHSRRPDRGACGARWAPSTWWSWACATASPRSPRRWRALQAARARRDRGAAAASRSTRRRPPARRSSASTRSLAQPWNVPPRRDVGAFYDDPGSSTAFAAGGARRTSTPFRPDHVLFSYHGLPERHMRKSDPSGRHCLQQPELLRRHRPARTATATARSATPPRARWPRASASRPNATRVSFQSRLGRTPWIKPYTDVVLPELAARGQEAPGGDVPGVRGRLPGDRWRRSASAPGSSGASLGGEELLLVPSLNAEPAWVEAVVRLVRDAAA